MVVKSLEQRNLFYFAYKDVSLEIITLFLLILFYKKKKLPLFSNSLKHIIYKICEILHTKNYILSAILYEKGLIMKMDYLSLFGFYFIKENV